MNDREKKLALAGGAVLGVFILLSAYKSMFAGPLAEMDTQVAASLKKVNESRLSARELLRSQMNMAQWTQQSLPPDPVNAQRVYHDWLQRLAEICGWENIDIQLSSAGTRRGARGGSKSVFTPVKVTITAEARLDEVARMLLRLNEVYLLQRITNLDLASPTNEGDPDLEVTLTTEGLSILNAPPRTELFSRTRLSETIDARDTEMTVADVEGFPIKAAPFRVRIGTEFLTVTQCNGQSWTVERGAAQSRRDTHERDADVELFPVRKEAAPPEFLLAYANFIERGPFTIYEPPGAAQFRRISSQRIDRGSTWSLRPDLENWPVEQGSPTFRLEADTLPDGLTIDKGTGEMRWNTADDEELAEYRIRLVATTEEDDPFEVSATFSLEVREPNRPPRLSRISDRDAYVGRELSFTVEAEDDHEGLRYSLGGDAPSGAEIDSRTGRFRWIPALDTELKEYTVEVTVTDDGSLRDSESFTIAVADDPAEYTVLVGYFENGGVPSAVFYDQSTNQYLTIGEGEALAIADLRGTIQAVRRGFIVVELGQRMYQLREGRNLRELEPLSNGT